MPIVYFAVVGDRLPYGVRGKTIRKGEKRTQVDFGKLGVWRVPNKWLANRKPDPVFGKAAKEALEILSEMGLTAP